MRNKLLCIAAVLLIAAIASVAVVGHFPENRELTAIQKEKLSVTYSNYMERMSGVAYVVHHGEVIFDMGSGMGNETKENSSDLVYCIASLTKQFTAACIMQLYEEGKLSLDDPLSKYFPEYRHGSRITIRHLLCQRSGIPDFSVEMVDGEVMIICYMDDGEGVSINESNTAEENRDIIREHVFSQHLLFRPGEAFDYSDSNFSLLADIVEIASKEKFHDYVRAHIFKPLGMEMSAFIDDNDFDKGIFAKTDRSEFDGDYYRYKGVEFGCGDIAATPKDLYRWYRGFVTGKVVCQDSYQLMTNNYSKDDELGYGFGLMISDKSESKVVYHYGWIPSFYSSMHYIPEYDYFQVLISNTSEGDPHQLAAQMAYRFGEMIELELVDID